MEERFSRFADEFTQKLEAIETKIASIQCNQQESEHSFLSQPVSRPNEHLPSAYSAISGHAVPGSPQGGATGESSDIQGEFQCLRDSLTRIKLPSELKLNDSRQGIRRTDQPLLNVVAKCGRYNETLVKLLTTIEPGSVITQETLDQLFVIAHAQCRYLQDEFASLVVNSQFDSNTSKLFRALQKNTSGLNSTSLETLRSAATIAAASRTATRGGYSGRGRQRGSFQSGGQRSDVFSQFTNRNFPRRQWAKGDNSSNHDDD